MTSRGELSAALESVLPQTVAVDVAVSDEECPPPFQSEAAVVAGAVRERQREFFTTRACARRALVRLGHPTVEILQEPDRAPRWPSGIVGSLTHCDGCRAAAVARRAAVRSIGIDAEVHAPLPDEVVPLVITEVERAMLAQLAVLRPDVAWDRLLFSAKESVFKAWYPLTREWLDFTECRVNFASESGSFRVEIASPSVAARRIKLAVGRWTSVGGHVLTAVTVPA